MKKIFFSLSTFALLTLLAGCSKEADNPVSLETGGGLQALIEPGTQTKTNYDSIEGKFVWTEGDQLAIHYNDGSYKTVAVEAATGAVDAPSPGSRNYYAVYPASVVDPANFGSPTLKITLPDSYDISDIVAGQGSADFSPCPMVASNASNTNKLNFYHVGGLLRVTLKDLPVLTQKIRVTFDSDVTGTYEVSNPGTTNPTINTRGESANNVVTFTLAADAIGTYAGEIVLNIPVPCGEYSSILFEALNTAGTSIANKTYNTRPLTFVRHHGKKMSFGGMEFNELTFPLDRISISSEEITLWAGETFSPDLRAYNELGTEIMDVSVTWTSSVPSIASVDSDGIVTAVASGRSEINVSVSKDGVTKTASYTVFVNEITGLTLNRSILYVRKGRSNTLLKASISHTNNGNITSEPICEWISADSKIANLSSNSTKSGEYNTLNGIALGNTIVYARIRQNTYGKNSLFEASCSIQTIRTRYIPGPYRVSDSERVFFASGNLQIEGTLSGTDFNDISWAFANEQYEVVGGQYDHSTIVASSGWTGLSPC